MENNPKKEKNVMKQERKVLYTNTKTIGKDNHCLTKGDAVGKGVGAPEARLRTMAKLSGLKCES